VAEELPLAGIRVLDLADESAVLATRLLADLGAEVILVEPPGGSPARHLAPFLDGVPGPERAYRHLHHNAGKRSVVLDLDGPQGAERFRALAAAADVLVETAPAGAMGARGFGPEQLHALNPHLVYVSVTPFGQEAGPRAGWRANDLVAGAAGGLVAVSGERADPPVHGPAYPSYALASLHTAAGALIALHGRDRHPDRPGVHVDISLQESTLAALVQTSNPNTWTWRGEIPPRPGLSQALECADGHWVGVNVLATRVAEFIAILEAEGVEHELTGDWRQVHAGRAPWRSLENPLQYAAIRLARRVTRERFLERMWSMNSAALPVLDFPGMAASEHYRANEQFGPVHHELLGVDLSFVRSAVDALTHRPRPGRAPALGEHTESILRSLPPPAGATAAAPVAVARPAVRGGAARTLPERPLEGIRVVDLCWVLAGPLGTRMLASFGADVIKVESAARPDGLRNAPQPDGRYAPDLGDVFNDANPGKRSLTLDLREERAKELLLELIARSDVVVDNFTSGALARMGFPYARLRAANPRVVVAHMSGPGPRGPWAPRRTLGNLLMAASGLSYLMGFPGRPPRGVGVAYPDFTSPPLIVAQVLAALRRRERTGEGCEIDFPQLSGTVSLLGAEWMAYARTGVQPPRPGNGDPNESPHGVYPTRGEDAWCAIAVRGDAEWARMAGAMGEPALARDPRFATHAARKANEDALEALVSAWTASWDGWELGDHLQRAGVAACPVEHLRDLIERDPLMRDHYQRVRQPSDPSVEITIDREAIRFAGHDRTLRRAPIRGEHSEEIVCGLLGRPREEFDALVAAGVIA